MKVRSNSREQRNHFRHRTGYCMHVAFDSWVLAQKFQATGVYLYSLRLLSELRRLASERDDLLVTAFLPEVSVNGAAQIPETDTFRCHRTSQMNHHRLWRLGGMSLAVRAIKPDIVLVPTPQMLPFTGTPIVTTIHDVSILTVNSQFSAYMTANLRFYQWVAAKFSDKILAMSECTKRDIMELYGVPGEKIEVTYQGINSAMFNATPAPLDLWLALQDKFGLTRPYLFHHGTIQPRKNLTTLIRAHRLMLERNKDLEVDLVLAGANGWLYDETLAEAAKTISPRGRVILTGAIPEEELVVLLKNATMAVIPSKYEGFCLPMVEAMACGIPTIVSNTSCFPEVSAGVLRYFDPSSIDEIASVAYDVLSDRSEQKRLTEQGLKVSARYSWRNCAEQTLQVLADVCGVPAHSLCVTQ